jgi:DNA polymerase-3 subunit epsilon/ATP-dependent DNA helicase DinG
VLVWLLDTTSGDVQEINLTGPSEREVWSRLSAEDEGCNTETCARRMEGICPFHRAHQAAQSSHLLIVNHALLLADVAAENRILPSYDRLIVDEAHHLESATTKALSFRLTRTDVDRLLTELGGSTSGVLGRIRYLVRKILRPVQLTEFEKQIQRATDLAFRFQNQTKRFFASLDDFLLEMRDGRDVGPYGHQERILPATRTQPDWMKVEVIWDEAQESLQLLLNQLKSMGDGLADLTDGDLEELEDLYGQFSTLYRRLIELHTNVNAFVFTPQSDVIYWAELNPSGERLSLHAAPLHIGPLMERYLWHEKSSIILTSATLSTAGEFDYLRGRLAAYDADELILGSPFDYENSALVYIVDNIPEPSDRQGHQKAVEKGLIRLCTATGGRTLALFTSYTQLKRTSAAIAPVLAEQDILVYEQGGGASPHSLLESFRSTERAVLLGTRSFWEGVDVPGEALSVLAIIKLPFDVPSDPIVASRAESFEDPFYQYSLPEAILRFRQGFGRLIRTQSDRGVVAIFDKRVVTKSYGHTFLESLPPCTVQRGPLEHLPRVASQWLNL